MRSLISSALADHRADPIILPTITLSRTDAIALLAVIERGELLSHNRLITPKGQHNHVR